MRAAIGLADVGIGVFLVEREPVLGGHVASLGRMYPHARNGAELAAEMIAQIAARPEITVFTGAQVLSKAGSFGNYQVGLRVGGLGSETLTVEVGSIIVATGFETYEPAVGEYGYGIDGVVTLPEFKTLLDEGSGPVTYNGRQVRDVAYIYCVGSRDPADKEGGHTYCSRYCCTATVAASIQLDERDPKVHQYHLYRDMRTFGNYELMYTESRKRGSVYMKFDQDEPPEVSRTADGRLTVIARDVLTDPQKVAVPVDLVVLVTGMVPRRNEELTSTLKLPIGRDGFYNEIHPKLRPVETTVDGVYIAGACQGPRNSAESVASGLATVTQSAVILKKGFAELDPLVAVVDADACTACGDCLATCPYTAIEMTGNGRQYAVISETACKGCGGCVPLCPENAIDLRGYTDAQITSMIDNLLEVSVP